MPLVDIITSLFELAVEVVKWAVNRWPGMAAAYIVATLFGVAYRKKWQALVKVAIVFVGPVFLWAVYRRSRLVRGVVRAVTLAGWAWIVRASDWPGRVMWVTGTVVLVFFHTCALFGFRSIWAGVPLTPRTYRQAWRDRGYLRSLRSDPRAVARWLRTDPTSGVMIGTGRPAVGKAPYQLVMAGDDETLGNAVNVAAELRGLDPVNLHVEPEGGADGGVVFMMWTPDRHPLNRDLQWPGPRPAGPDDPVPLGVTIRGAEYTIPAPGKDGQFVLSGGTTGGGKTTTMNVGLAELASRPHTDFVICDPKRMDYSWMWGDRALWIAETPTECVRAAEAVFEEMEFRRIWGARHRMRTILPGVAHDPDRCDVCQRYGWDRTVFSRLHLVVDEMADIVLAGDTIPNPDGGRPLKVDVEFHRHTQRIAGTGRACAIGQWLSTQSPKSTVVPMLTRENSAVRLCFRTEEPEQTDAILGSQRIPAHTALNLKGECFGKQETTITRWRGHYAFDAQLEDVIAGSAHLRGRSPFQTEEVVPA